MAKAKNVQALSADLNLLQIRDNIRNQPIKQPQQPNRAR